MMPDPSGRSGQRLAQWGVAFIVAVPLTALLAALWPALNDPWVNSYTYSHGYLVLALAVWLAVHEARREPLPVPRASWLGFSALAAAALAGLFAQLGDAQIGEQLAVPLLLFTALWAAAGWRIARRFVWSIGYLVFGISVWDSVNGVLRSLTTAVAGSLTRLVGIPAFIGANEIHIPAGTFAVEGGCSGLHYMIAATALSAFYGLTSYRRWTSRFALFALVVAVALAANWVRVFVVVLDGQFTDMQGYLVRHHYYFGWVLFFVMLAPVFLAARHLEPAREGSGAGNGKARESVSPPPSIGNSAVAAVSFCVLAAAAGLAFTAARVVSTRAGSAITLPRMLAGWGRAGEWTGPGRPRYVRADHQAAAVYRKGRQRLGVFVARYDAQRQGSELVYFANSPAGNDADAAKPEGTVQVATAAGGSFPAAQLLVSRSDGGRRLVWYTYDVAGWYTAKAVIAKLYQGLGLLRQRSDASVLVLSARCRPDCTAARGALSSFTRAAGPVVFRLAAPQAGSRKSGGAK